MPRAWRFACPLWIRDVSRTRRAFRDINAPLARQHHPRLPISLTTDGVGLEKKAKSLKAAGLTRVNGSLDSLHEEILTQLTRRPFLGQVPASVEAARAVGLGPVKINAVLILDRDRRPPFAGG